MILKIEGDMILSTVLWWSQTACYGGAGVHKKHVCILKETDSLYAEEEHCYQQSYTPLNTPLSKKGVHHLYFQFQLNLI